MYDLLIDIASGAAAGGCASWILRDWISERLKQSISHEYSTKLENTKNELNAKLESLRHTYEISQLRTSLFFDHQRDAFAEILSKVACVNQKWCESHDQELGLIDAVPSNELHSLKEAYVRHQLFLDTDAIMAIELLIRTYHSSFPYHDGEKEHPRDPSPAYLAATYIQPRLAALFQKKIGVSDDARPVKQIALLGAMGILNQYHFQALQLPTKGNLTLNIADGPAEAVMKAERHFPELMERLRSFQKHLQTETTFFHEAELSLGRYINILGK